jgi:regulatory protein
MAGRVTALEPQKRSKDRVNVYLDGEYAFSLATIVATKLRTGTWLTDEDIADLQVEDGLERAHGRALDYLSYRPRSTSELRRYLSDKDYPETVVNEEIDRLERAGLVDDVEFARYWLDNRARFRPRGKRMLRYELSRKGIPSRIIDEVLEEYDEAAAIEKAAQGQARRLKHLPPDKFRHRLFERLARRGFSYDLIQETITPQNFPQLNESQSEED